ncbi:MAG: hypothetical protein V4463_05695 [Pseudomonadota bacterium]
MTHAVPPAPRFRPIPWTGLTTPQDVELWIEEHNRSLLEHISPTESGYGVCFTLAEGGRVYLQTTGDAIVLDVDDEAGWIAPLICAATGATEPRGAIWILPDDRLVQLVLGLSSLVASTVLVVGHPFGRKSLGRQP